jgi:hypothetical protein
MAAKNFSKQQEKIGKSLTVFGITQLGHMNSTFRSKLRKLNRFGKTFIKVWSSAARTFPSHT